MFDVSKKKNSLHQLPLKQLRCKNRAFMQMLLLRRVENNICEIVFRFAAKITVSVNPTFMNSRKNVGLTSMLQTKYSHYRKKDLFHVFE